MYMYKYIVWIIFIFFIIYKYYTKPIKSTKTQLLNNESISQQNIIYCFWTGKNKMSNDRKNCLSSLKKITECNVMLITPDNLDKYILDEHPLHAGFKYLSETHKADYLRTYFMRHHGGGYADIKIPTGSWVESFNTLRNSNKWMIGYKEVEGGTSILTLTNKWYELIGNGAYICKPNTPLVNEWYNEMLEVMDNKYKLLINNPSTFPQDQLGSGSGYPIAWTELLGDIFHKYNFKYKDKCLNTLPIPIFDSYR